MLQEVRRRGGRFNHRAVDGEIAVQYGNARFGFERLGERTNDVAIFARRVGDVLTIRLTESTNASKNAATKTAKTTAVNNTGPTILGRTITAGGVPIFTTTLAGADSFDGSGSSTQGNSLAGSLTVTVMAVQPNGNLVVQGDKTLKLNQGDEFVHVSGVVRCADIATDNTVSSDKIADAHINLPEGFTPHPRVKPVLERRAKMAREGDIDWAFGELLAFGSLNLEGKLVRLAGQDSRRGTFVSRFATLTATGTETPAEPPIASVTAMPSS